MSLAKPPRITYLKYFETFREHGTLDFPDTNRLRLKLSNDYQMSIISGPGTYGELRYKDPTYYRYANEFSEDMWFDVETAEIAIFTPDGAWFTEGDSTQVWGYITVPTVVQTIEALLSPDPTTAFAILNKEEGHEPESE